MPKMPKKPKASAPKKSWETYYRKLQTIKEAKAVQKKAETLRNSL